MNVAYHMLFPSAPGLRFAIFVAKKYNLDPARVIDRLNRLWYIVLTPAGKYKQARINQKAFY